MQSKHPAFTVDINRLVGIASVTMFVHALCGLLRYLMNVNAVLALDYASTLALVVSAILYSVHFRPKPFGLVQKFVEYRALALAFLLCLVSAAANFIIQGKKGVYFAPNALHDVALTVFVYFPFGMYIASNGVPKLALRLFKALLTGWSLFMIVVLGHLFTGKVLILPGNIKIGGTWTNSVLCLNNNPNHTSCIESVFFVLCLFMAMYLKHASGRVLYSAFALIHYAGMTLSNSRTYIAAILAFLAMFAFFVALRWVKVKNKPLRLLCAGAIALAACAAAYLLGRALLALYGICPHYTDETMEAQTSVQSAGEYFGSIRFRFRMWKECLKALLKSPLLLLFGNGPANSKALVYELVGYSYYTHNQLLEIAVCAGVPCLIAFVAFVALILRDSWQFGKANLSDALKLFFILYLLSLLLANTMEALLIFYRRPGSYVFYTSCGWICGQARLMRNSNRDTKAPELP